MKVAATVEDYMKVIKAGKRPLYNDAKIFGLFTEELLTTVGGSHFCCWTMWQVKLPAATLVAYQNVFCESPVKFEQVFLTLYSERENGGHYYSARRSDWVDWAYQKKGQKINPLTSMKNWGINAQGILFGDVTAEEFFNHFISIRMKAEMGVDFRDIL
jgi:hypothetical protein